MARIFVIMKEDLITYPPALSVIRALIDLNYDVIHIGDYSDSAQKNLFKEKGVRFYELGHYNGYENFILKLYHQLEFRKNVKKILCKEKCSKTDDFVWLLNAETVVLLGDISTKYRVIFHYFEFTMPFIRWRYRMVGLFTGYTNPVKINKQAFKIIECEYNRAHIFKGILHLDELPVVLPNKPYNWDGDKKDVPEDINSIITSLKIKLQGKKAIIYQGVFQGKDRRLDEFFESLPQLPDDFVMVAMGPESETFFLFRKKYESERAIFIPFVRPPYHLEITKLCKIGILSYVANGVDFGGVINPLYCAPNKIFEYAKFGIPMIANDLPGLTSVFKVFKCGETIGYPMTVEKIKRTVEKISNCYDIYSEGAKAYYESIDLANIIKGVLN